MFSRSRFEIARKRRGFSKKRLADLIGVSDRMVLAYETGEHIPSDETLRLISGVLDFPIGFFSGDKLPKLEPDAASFRALSTLTAGKRDAALTAGQLAGLIEAWINNRFNLPQPMIPDFRGQQPEAAAEALRSAWDLGYANIKNMVHLLESKGVRVFSLPSRDSKVDAFCFWRDDVPFILLNTTKSGERGRFDAAHELGHLVLHRHGDLQGREAELEADRFASAFLMPRSSVVSHATGFMTVERILSLKTKWNVSAMALCYRLKSVGVLSEWTYTQLCRELSSRGYRRQEKDGIAHETSQVIAKVLQALQKSGASRLSMARELHLSQAELSGLLFGLPLSLLDGGSGSKALKVVPHLELV